MSIPSQHHSGLLPWPPSCPSLPPLHCLEKTCSYSSQESGFHSLLPSPWSPQITKQMCCWISAQTVEHLYCINFCCCKGPLTKLLHPCQNPSCPQNLIYYLLPQTHQITLDKIHSCCLPPLQFRFLSLVWSGYFAPMAVLHFPVADSHPHHFGEQGSSLLWNLASFLKFP